MLRSTHLAATQDKLACKFRCLLNLPLPDLQCFAFSSVSPALWVWWPVSEFTWEAPEVATNKGATQRLVPSFTWTDAVSGFCQLAFTGVSDACAYSRSQKGQNFPELLGLLSNKHETRSVAPSRLADNLKWISPRDYLIFCLFICLSLINSAVCLSVIMCHICVSSFLASGLCTLGEVW